MASSKKHSDDFLSHLQKQGSQSKTVESYRRYLAQFLGFLSEEDLHLRKVTSRIIEKFLRLLIDKGQRADLIHSALNQLFDFLKDQGWPSNPSKPVRIPYGQWNAVRFLTVEQREKYLQSLPRFQGDEEALLETVIVELLFATGMKTGQLRNLEVSDIQESSVTIREKKRTWTVPIGKVARDALLDYRRYLKRSVNYGPKLFQGLKNHGQGIPGKAVERIVKKYGKKIGLPKVTPSGIRHTVRQHLIDEGADDQQLEAILGSSVKPLIAIPYEQESTAAVDTFKEVLPKRLPMDLKARKTFVGTVRARPVIVPLIDELAHKLGKSHSEIVESAVSVLYERSEDPNLPGLEFGPVRLLIKRRGKPNTNFYLTNDAAQSIYELSSRWCIEFPDILTRAILEKYEMDVGKYEY